MLDAAAAAATAAAATAAAATTDRWKRQAQNVIRTKNYLSVPHQKPNTHLSGGVQRRTVH